jgi:hypothetical protein
MHVGAVGEVPDLVVWPTEKASTAQRIVAAREEPGSCDEPAQLKPKPHDLFGAFVIFSALRVVTI